MARIMAKMGFTPMPWQVQVLDTAYEIDDEGELVYREAIEIVPRQAGKTSKNLATQVHRALKMSERLDTPQRSVYLAQKQLDARNKLIEEHLPILEVSPFGPLFTPSRSTGNEGLMWINGSVHHVAAPTAKAGHGGSLDLVQIDEAFIHEDNRVEQGVKPTMITRQSPQLWITSAAGNMKSTYLRAKLELGRENVRHGIQSGIAYFEWSAPEDSDPTDPKVWEETHPAISHTIRAKDLEADSKSMAIEEFARSYLGIWPTRSKPRVVSETAWDACRDLGSQPLDPVSFAIDVTPDRSYAAISAAGRTSDGAIHVEVIRHEPGTGWVVEFVAGLLKRNHKSTCAIDTVGAAASLLPEFERSNVPVRLLTTADVGRSAGLFLDKVNQAGLRHRDQTSLNLALAGATTRKIGDKWGWGRQEGVDISPLCAATLAMWSLETAPVPTKYKMGLIV